MGGRKPNGINATARFSLRLFASKRDLTAGRVSRLRNELTGDAT